MTARVEGGREEILDWKADSEVMSWTVAMVERIALWSTCECCWGEEMARQSVGYKARKRSTSKRDVDGERVRVKSKCWRA